MSDPIATNPELYSLAFENERVRVLRYHDRPGDLTEPHDHPDSVMITFSDFDRRLHHAGRSVDATLRAGEVRWLDAQEHSGQNIGDTDSVVFFIELKDGSAAAAKGGPVELGPRA